MELDQTIAELKARLHKMDTLEVYIEELKQKLDANDDALTKAEEAYEKEYKDVEKLKKMSLQSFFAYLHHDKEERLAKEEQEAMHAAFHMKQLESDRESMLRELHQCEQEVAQRASVEKTLEEALLERSYRGLDTHEAIVKIRDAMEKLRQEDKEIDEALAAGDVVLQKLNQACDTLRDAHTWGTIDMFGGGLMSAMIKHSHMNNAQQTISEIEKDLRRFQKELKDVGDYQIHHVDMSMGNMVMDIAFDNIFTDYMIRSQIEEVQDSVLALLRKVDETCTKLQTHKQKVQEEYERQHKKYETLLNKDI